MVSLVSDEDKNSGYYYPQPKGNPTHEKGRTHKSKEHPRPAKTGWDAVLANRPLATLNNKLIPLSRGRLIKLYFRSVSQHNFYRQLSRRVNQSAIPYRLL